MKRHLNLMSDRSRFRESMRRRMRQWSWVLAFTALVLLPLGSFQWWNCRQERQQREIVEQLYEPIRALKKKNVQLQKQIEALRLQERIPLVLSNEKPVSVLLGLVGKAVAESNGQVYVQHLHLQQDPIAAAISNQPSATVELKGLGLHGAAVARFVDSLRTTLPFSSVELASTQAVELHQQTRQTVTIRCSF